MTLRERLLEARMHRELSRANEMIRGLREFLMETVEENHRNQHGDGHWTRCQEPRCVNAHDLWKATYP
jgi:hypothetical protein